MRTRAERMDEALDIVTGLWRGQPFNYTGKHYRVRETTFHPPPPPIQQTIWVVGLLGSARSMARVTTYQGLLPSVRGANGKWRKLEHEDVRQMRALVSDAGCGPDFDIIVEGTTPEADPGAAAATIEAWEEAGATCRIESLWEAQFEPNPQALLAARIRSGPPGQS